MITLSQRANHERTGLLETHNKPSESVETAGSLAMLYHQGLLTMGQYDEFISSNPFMVDYSMYASYESSDIAYGGFLSDFSNAVSTLGDMGSSGFSAGFSDAGCSSSGSCGGFSSVC